LFPWSFLGDLLGYCASLTSFCFLLPFPLTSELFLFMLALSVPSAEEVFSLKHHKQK
jgi:hypothetical protein